MPKKEKERYCMNCGKLLIDERFPLCRRCRLVAGDNIKTVGKTAAEVGAVAVAGVYTVSKFLRKTIIR